MDDKTIITHVSLSADEKIVVEKNFKGVRPPNHYRVGNGTMNRDKILARDFIGELINLSKPAQRVIGWIKDGMTYNPYDEYVEFVVRVVPDSTADKQMLKKGFKELQAIDLVRRVKRGYYMIDPHAITTKYDEQLKVWNSLEEEKIKDQPEG